MIVPHSLYRCNECREEQMVSDQDVLKSKLDGWLTVKLHVFGGIVAEHHYCAKCQPGVLRRYCGETPPLTSGDIDVFPAGH